MQTIEILAKELVDYAGLFPPAGLPMQSVVNNFRDYKDGPSSSMLGRLVIPTSRLEEFESLARHLLPDTTKSKPWRISALVPPTDTEDAGFDAALLAIESFNVRHQKPQEGKAVVDAIEIKAASSSQIQEIGAALPPGIMAFIEIPHADDPSELIECIGSTTTHEESGLFAKIRTGGVTEELIPPVDQVARFIGACARLGVGFKATAGLHNPWRCDAKLTYEPDSERAVLHGFFNVFLAAAFAFVSSGELDVTELLGCPNAETLKFADKKISWRGDAVSAKELRALRKSQAISFGSCSFDEPAAAIAKLLESLA